MLKSQVKVINMWHNELLTFPNEKIYMAQQELN